MNNITPAVFGQNCLTLATSIIDVLSVHEPTQSADSFELMAAMCLILGGQVSQLTSSPDLREQGMQMAFGLIRVAVETAPVAGVPLAHAPAAGNA